MRYLITIITLTVMLISNIGCDYFGFTNIKEIVDSPLKFEEKEIKIKGIVENSLKIPIVETVVYTLKDDSGKIIIISSGLKPNDGEKIKVKGTVYTAVKIGAETFGTHIKEIKRW